MDSQQKIIQHYWQERQTLNPKNTPQELKTTIDSLLHQLDQGKIRVAEKIAGIWQVNQSIKQAILLYFRISENRPMLNDTLPAYDKIPLKYSGFTQAEFEKNAVRIVPPATARYGSYLAPNVILMPSYINIGAYVDSGSLIDTWATVGSCAQIGKNVHISGGVGIGGVLEPLQANPVIIEDNCFIGARSEIVEGVIVEENAVISMGVFIGQSTKIYDRETGEIIYGRVPAGSVVVPGSLPAKDNSHHLACAVIIKKVDAKTREKISLNELLREN